MVKSDELYHRTQLCHRRKKVKKIVRKLFDMDGFGIEVASPKPCQNSNRDH